MTHCLVDCQKITPLLDWIHTLIVIVCGAKMKNFSKIQSGRNGLSLDSRQLVSNTTISTGVHGWWRQVRVYQIWIIWKWVSCALGAKCLLPFFATLWINSERIKNSVTSTKVIRLLEGPLLLQRWVAKFLAPSSTVGPLNSIYFILHLWRTTGQQSLCLYFKLFKLAALLHIKIVSPIKMISQ